MRLAILNKKTRKLEYWSSLTTLSVISCISFGEAKKFLKNATVNQTIITELELIPKNNFK